MSIRLGSIANTGGGLRLGSIVYVALDTPVLTDVDTDEVVTSDQTGVAVTGANLGTTNANRVFELVQGSTAVAQTETGTGDDTSATLSIVTEPGGAAIKFGAATLRVTRDDDAEGTIAITVNPPSGQVYVDVGTPDSEAANRITAVPDIASGDQLHARGVGGGAAPTGLTVNADGTFQFSSGNEPAPFDVRVWDASDATWGSWATQSIGSTGALSGSVTIAVSSQGSLNGGSALEGNAAVAIAAQSALSALGELSGSIATNFANLATLAAYGELLGISSFTVSPEGSLNGGSVLEGNAAIAVAAQSVLSALGELSGSITTNFANLATLAAYGELLGISSFTVSPEGSLSTGGSNSIQGNAQLTLSPQANIHGIGQLGGLLPLSFNLQGSTGGVVAVSGTTSIALAPQAVLQAMGDLEGVIPLAINALGGLETLGNLLGSADLTFAVNGSIHGTGDLEGSTHLVFAPEGDLLDGSTMNGRVFLALSPQGSMEAMGELAGSSPIVVTQSANLQGIRQASGSIELGFVQTAQLFGKGDLLGQSLLTISPEALLEVDSDLKGHIQISLSCIAEISGGISISIVGDDLGFADLTAENSFGVIDGSMGFGEV